MIVRYLLEDDYETWNHFVEQSPQGFIWDYSWWLEIVTDGDYKICALFDDDNLIVAGISLPFFLLVLFVSPIDSIIGHVI